jgi:hypothetical protein
VHVDSLYLNDLPADYPLPFIQRKHSAHACEGSDQEFFVQVSKMLLAQTSFAAAADVCDLLEVFASAYWHPSLPVLNAAQEKLEACCSDLQLVNLCTSLWSFAIFAFVPHISLQRVYATRIEQEIEDLNPFQLCSVLWVFALFRSCTVGVWNTLVSKLGTFDVSEIDDSALRYFYQVYMFIRASANTINLDAYRMPQRLLTESDKAWRLKKREESRQSPTEFDLDVKRVLGLLQFKDVQMKVCTVPYSEMSRMLMLMNKVV